MMPERAFWEELERLLIQDDLEAAADLVHDQFEAFHAALRAKYDECRPVTKH